ncbi:peptidoglycan editing factor PgeF [Sphingomonas sp. RHCKR7]|uniref:peptidoglycan editing factor PgeF n=1 Tax=Sphingomonas folli TaxID=2862497 RepID=UPI001CA5C241|nr:peptidoglycan editing factor PgeF [Sphingomonas folli]MBW6526876.1 peptidoglycan editing factor PgeF [Sphingomonas folli]
MTGPQPFRARLLGAVPHGFLGREDGASEGLYAGLNCGIGSEDDPAAVAANRDAALAAVAPGARLVTPYQVHSADCATVDAPVAERPRADALATSTPGLALGVVTADCAPVLLADPVAGVVGAAHAGWKGALAGVTDSTVAAMVALGAVRERIVAAVGPCVARASYEVDAGFRDRFLDDDAANDRFFADGRAGHARFDLEGYVAHRLAAAGVVRVETLGLDTYADERRFFSYRRSTHRGEPAYGRQIAIIAVG